MKIEKKDLSSIQKSMYGKYCCPTCGQIPPDEAYKRTSKRKIYPEYYNYRAYFNGDIDRQVWDEVHYCNQCLREYQFQNGN